MVFKLLSTCTCTSCIGDIKVQVRLETRLVVRVAYRASLYPRKIFFKIINYNCAIKELKKEKMQVYASECVGVCKCAFVDKSTQ